MTCAQIVCVCMCVCACVCAHECTLQLRVRARAPQSRGLSILNMALMPCGKLARGIRDFALRSAAEKTRDRQAQRLLGTMPHASTCPRAITGYEHAQQKHTPQRPAPTFASSYRPSSTHALLCSCSLFR